MDKDDSVAAPDPKATNWDAYYSKPASPAQFTRKISERKIIGLFDSFSEIQAPTIAELGGANSCFADAILQETQPSRYVAIDNNRFGLSLLEKRFQDSDIVEGQFGDALNLNPAGEGYDIVFSVGLIEHFDRDGTAACVKAHFDLCKTGGVILITFPTPTLLYKSIRGLAEVTNNWHFHDERPLKFQEVETASRGRGELLHRSINWAIGLTQGYLVYRKV